MKIAVAAKFVCNIRLFKFSFESTSLLLKYIPDTERPNTVATGVAPISPEANPYSFTGNH